MSVLDRIARVAGDPATVERHRAALRQRHGRAPTLRELLRAVMLERERPAQEPRHPDRPTHS